MTIEEARKILGKEVESKTDKEILNIIGVLTTMVDIGFEQLEARRFDNDKRTKS